MDRKQAQDQEVSRSEADTLSSEQREIIALLQGELQELLVEEALLFSRDQVDEQINEIQGFATSIEHLANASELAGLRGLAMYFSHLTQNVNSLAKRENAPFPPLKKLIFCWIEPVQHYLNTLGCPEPTSGIEDLLLALRSSKWPLQVNESFEQSLMDAFGESQVIQDTRSAHDIPHLANAGMCSLHIDDDAHAELLSGLKLELPEQVRQFESSVSAYLESDNLQELAQAQRMAHTLKGAGNIVGIKGIANLMHYTEDLLDTVERNSSHLPEKFADALQSAADCLAEMAECICGLGPEPETSVSALQDILDCLHEVITPVKHNGTQTEISQEETNELAEFESFLDSKYISDAQLADIDALLSEDSPLLEAAKNHSPRQLLTTPDASVSKELAATKSSALIPDESSPGPSSPSRPSSEENNAIPEAENREERIKRAKESPDENTEVSAENEEESFHIQVAESTAQDLLRLTGETQITNSRVFAQIELLKRGTENADVFHKSIRSMAMELENMVETQSALRAATAQFNDDEIDPLEMERFSELHTFSQRLMELTTDSYEEISSLSEQLQELSNVAWSQMQLNKDNQEVLLALRLVPVKLLASRFSRCVRQACRLTKKSARFELVGEDLQVDSRVLNRLADPIMHLLRNAVDHGLEDSARTRKEANKEPEGLITLSFKQSGEILQVECRDDGRGLESEKIKQKALQKGLCSDKVKMNNQALCALIMLPGFSTREKVSQTSGRGIGLDVVRQEIKELKGNIKVSSSAGEGTCFSLSVPTSIITGHALQVKNRGRKQNHTLSIVSRSIDLIVHLQPKDLLVEGENTWFEYQAERIPVYALHELTNMEDGLETQPSSLLLTHRQDGSAVAVAVENIISSQDLVIKPLNKYTWRPPGVLGATILGDGTVSPVLDLLELPGINLSGEERALLKSHQQQQARKVEEQDLAPPIALVVDDSLSARRSLAQFLTDLGMEVHTAKDGFEAISVLVDRQPTLMLVDLEMPRMNGLELTSHLKSREDTRDIPVIMITSRSTDKHRSMARKAGVNNYLNKPWSEEELLSVIQQQIAS